MTLFIFRLFHALLIFLICHGISVIPAMAASPASIRVVMDNNYPPYVFMDEQGNLKGILIDHWKLWEQKTGIKVEITGMDWGEAQRLMREGRFDVIDTIFRSQQREQLYDFSKPYARLNVPLFFRADISGISGPQDAKGFVVAAKKGDASIDFLKKQGITSIAEYPSYESIIAAARENKVKVFTVDAPPAYYYLHKMNIHDRFMETVPMFSGEFHRAVLKGQTQILTIVEQGFASITPAEYAAINRRWLGASLSGGTSLDFLWYLLGVLICAGTVMLAWLFFLRRAVRTKTSELAENEERYRQIIFNMQDVYYRSDASGRLTMLSPSGARLLGYDSVDDMLGRVIRDTFYHEPEERDAFLHNLRLKKEVYGYEIRLRHKDGHPIPVATSTHLMHDQNGNYCGVEGVFRDITDQKIAEDALRASEHKFSLAFSQAPLLMSISDIDSGRYLEVNRRFCEISGFSETEAVGKTSIELGWISPSERDRLISSVKGNGRIEEIELTLTAKDGRPVTCLYSAEIITINGTQRLLSIALDITERKQAEAQLIQNRIQIQQEQEKAQRLESLGLLAGGIAHDFNNILTGILGNISMARMMVGEGHRASKRLLECEKATMRASELTRQLLTFSRGGEPVKKPLATAQLITDSVSFALRGSNLRQVVSLSDNLWKINADEGQISQVLNNLLLNAKQAMPHGGEVLVTARNLPADHMVMICIHDTGSGIPEEHLPFIFDPYFTTKPEGSGLGLASVYSIISRHGGSVTVNSSTETGTEFVLFLPAADQEPEDPAAPARRLAADIPAGLKVLVMDDEELIRDVAAEMLSAMGCSVDSCVNGNDAVTLYQNDMLQGSPYDLALMDLTIPGAMGGLEAANLIKQIDINASLIVSSGYSNDAVIASFDKYGFAGVVMKPYNLDIMHDEIARVLKQKELKGQKS